MQSTLAPALAFSDIGPVLSLTGAVGGSCLAYLGPGLVCLGLNGEEFLTRIGSYLESWRRRKGYSASSNYAEVTEGDLPVLAKDSEEYSYEKIKSGRKPLWYYILLLPIWTSIANSGATNMRKKLAAKSIVPDGSSGTGESKEVLPNPTNLDFCVCIFFIVFGIVSAVAGVLSYVYVQMDKYSDTEAE